MIEKSIRYEVNIEKPSKTKPVKQGGVLNYLGKQKTVNAPVKWRSGPTHPETHLAYITKDEEKILIDLNIYKSMKNGKPNRGPFGLPSLNDGGNSGGDSGGDGGGNSGGSGGVGGSDASGNAGNATGDSAGVGGSGAGTGGQGAGSGPGGESGTGGVANGPSGIGGAEEGFGIGPNDAVNPSIDSRESVLDSYLGFVEENINKPMENVKTTLETYMQQINPLDTLFGIASKIPGIGLALSAYRNSQKGVTTPNDYTQEQTSVQSSTPGQNNSEGIGTMQAYAPLYNSLDTSGDPTMDAYIKKLRINLGLPV